MPHIRQKFKRSWPVAREYRPFARGVSESSLHALFGGGLHWTGPISRFLEGAPSALALEVAGASCAPSRGLGAAQHPNALRDALAARGASFFPR